MSDAPTGARRPAPPLDPPPAIALEFERAAPSASAHMGGGLYADLAVDYELLGELGRGGSAVVYRARDRRLGREVALKVVRVAPALAGGAGAPAGDAPAAGAPAAGASEAVARLAREARTIAALEHPHIVRVHAVRELPDGLALEMPLIRGRTLKQLLAEGGPLAPERAARVLGDVARALAFAHARGVVHRDVKPENVFVEDGTGHALLADFGVARSAEADAPEARLTQTGVTLGTPAYMSPEQIEGRRVDGRSDVYSLGLLGWELLTGQRPWAGEGLFAVLQRQQQDALPPIETVRPAGLAPVPLALQYVLERMMQKAPGARWAGAEAVAAQMARQQPPPADFARWRRHHAVRVRDARRAPHPPLLKRPAALVRSAVDTLRFARADADSPTDRLAVPTGDPAGTGGRTTGPEPSAPVWASGGRVTSRVRLAVLGGTLVAGLGTTLAVRAASAGVESPRPERSLSAAVRRAAPSVGATPGAPSRVVSTSRGDVAAAAPAAPTRREAVPTPREASAPPAALPAAAGAPAVPTGPGALARLASRVRGMLPFGGAAAREDSPPAESTRPVHPPALLGPWAHGDGRSRYGDSLLLELRADGTARESARRYAPDGARGWRAVLVEHDGRWEMRYGTFGGATLCVTWRGMGEARCEPAVVDRTSDGAVLTYGGRHWRSPLAQR